MEENYGFKPPYQQCTCSNYPTPESLSYPTPPNACSLHNPQPYPSQSFPQPPSQSFLQPPVDNVFNSQSQQQLYQQAYRWVDSSTDHGSVPPTAVQGGVDIDGHPIYVGRAYHEGDLIPCKVIPGKNEAYVCHGGEEHAVDTYQVLCQQRLEWVPSQAGHLPPGAVSGGQTSDGEPLYIGRSYHEGSQVVGKIQPSHGVCYIPFDGKEIACPTYETLVLKM